MFRLRDAAYTLLASNVLGTGWNFIGIWFLNIWSDLIFVATSLLVFLALRAIFMRLQDRPRLAMLLAYLAGVPMLILSYAWSYGTFTYQETENAYLTQIVITVPFVMFFGIAGILVVPAFVAWRVRSELAAQENHASAIQIPADAMEPLQSP